MRRLLIAIPVFLTIFGMSSSGWSATYYVDKNHSKASDSNAGSESAPWSTIQKAANVAKAGDTVLVKSGTYKEWVEVYNSGAAGKPIIFKTYPGHNPIIDGSGIDVPSNKALFFTIDKSYVTIDGFEVRNSDEYLIRMRSAGTKLPWVSNVVVRNCKIHGNASKDIDGIHFDYVDGGLIDNNECYDSGWNCMNITSSHNVIIQHNYIHSNPKHAAINIFPKVSESPQGLYHGNNVLYNVVSKIGSPGAAIYTRYQTNNLIMGNVVNGNTTGIVFDFDRTTSKYSHAANTKVINNTIVNNSNFGFRSNNASNVTLLNNIFAYNGSTDVLFQSGTTADSRADYNLYYSSPKFNWGSSSYSSLSSWASSTGNDRNSFDANPGFVGLAGDDFRLNSSSIAIDAGTDVSAYGLVSDIDGRPRPQGKGYDIGAYEYGATTLTLSGLTISGPASVDENSSANYTATAAWSDGSTSTVAPLWSEDSPYATISADGILTTLSVTADQTVTISAGYTSGDATKTATKAVSLTTYEPPSAELPPDAIDTELGAIAAPMQIVSSADAPGGYYIETTALDSGSAVYNFNVAEPGIYKIVAEVYAGGSSSDSFLVKIGDGPENVWDLNPEGDPALYGAWRQDEVAARGTGTFDAPQFDPLTVQLEAGNHTITFSGREPNTRLAYSYLMMVSAAAPPPSAEPPPDAAGQPSPKVLLFRAESGELTPETMAIVSALDVPGGSYITPTSSTSSSAVYDFNLDQPGTYKIVTEVYSAGTSADSFLVKIDDGAEDVWDLNPKGDPALYNFWRQDEVTARGKGTFDAPQFDPLKVQLGAGNHRITISGRELNSRLAYFYLIMVPAFTELIEAESGTLSAPMQVVLDATASGGAYIATSSNNAGSAVYSFSIVQPGIYKIIANIYCADASSDSFLVKIGDGPEEIWDFNPEGDPALYGVWRQDEVAARGTGTFDAPQLDPLTVQLEAGNHTITFSGRETNARLDNFYLMQITTEPSIIKLEID
jgi:hypothetical protein